MRFYTGRQDDLGLRTHPWVAFDRQEIESPIWLTPDKKFAQTNAGHHGFVYTVEFEPRSLFGAGRLMEFRGNYLEPTQLGIEVLAALERGEIFHGVSADDAYDVLKAIDWGYYDVMETKAMIDWLKARGHDSMEVTGDGPINIAVFDPSAISVTSVEPATPGHDAMTCEACMRSRPNPASDDGRYYFVHACPGSTYEDIWALKGTERKIARETFVRKIGARQWAEIQASLGYDRYFPISRDRFIRYFKGVYRKAPCVFLRHSGIEHIFTLDGKLGPSAGAPGAPNPSNLRARPGAPGRRTLGEGETRRNADANLRTLRRLAETGDLNDLDRWWASATRVGDGPRSQVDTAFYEIQADRLGLREIVPVGNFGPSGRREHQLRVGGAVQIAGHIGYGGTSWPLGRWGRVTATGTGSVIVAVPGDPQRRGFQVTKIHAWRGGPPTWVTSDLPRIVRVRRQDGGLSVFLPDDPELERVRGRRENPREPSKPPHGGTTKRVEKFAIYRHKACEKRLGKKVVWRKTFVVDVEKWNAGVDKWGAPIRRRREWWWGVDPSTGRDHAYVDGPPQTPCPECGNLVSGEAIHGVKNDAIPCTAKCVAATGPSCECSCAGANHGASWGGGTRANGSRPGDERFAGDPVVVYDFFAAGSAAAAMELGSADEVSCVRCGARISDVFLTNYGPMGGDCVATLTGDDSSRALGKKLVKSLLMGGHSLRRPSIRFTLPKGGQREDDVYLAEAESPGEHRPWRIGFVRERELPILVSVLRSNFPWPDWLEDKDRQIDMDGATVAALERIKARREGRAQRPALAAVDPVDDEIAWARGRGITTREQYLVAKREGRQRMTRPERLDMWKRMEQRLLDRP